MTYTAGPERRPRGKHVIIAGDIGGTNARLALFENNSMVFRWSCPSREYDEFYPAFRAFLRDASVKSLEKTTVCLAVAGVIEGTARAKGTNIPWIIDCGKLIKETGCLKCMVINDFEAAAWGVTVIPEKRCTPVGKAGRTRGSTMAVIGAGTGLGQAVIPCDAEGRYMVVPSEGGHAGFAPENRQELELLSYLMSRFGHVSVERLLSGQGLVNIYSFLKGKPAIHLAEGVENDRLAPEITRKALAGTDQDCTAAVELFCRIYGSEAGNLALKCLPKGGVYVAGGIAPVILPFIKRSGFREAFENKGCMRDLLEKIPVFVVQEPDLGLIGAAARATYS